MTGDAVGKIRVACKVEANTKIVEIELIKRRYHAAGVPACNAMLRARVIVPRQRDMKANNLVNNGTLAGICKRIPRHQLASFH